ncbi:hypothetical protein RJ53_06200 [Methanocalculus chunghsingensis]|uniref:Uncharacterized protein n=1 Tax=Methanocalculus chunghsingensis TaxID=156457 RepID=A0A8J7W9Y3_9EURY|nr:hypothetical protein [Methanocalculus chunghsingensis]
MRPRSASASMTTPGSMSPRIDGPRIRPAPISPTSPGYPIRSASSPAAFATARRRSISRTGIIVPLLLSG